MKKDIGTVVKVEQKNKIKYQEASEINIYLK